MIFNLLQKPCPRTDRGYPHYQMQRELAHRLGLKATMCVSAAFCDDQEIITECLADKEKYGDEIALLLSSDVVKYKGCFSWLLPADKKKAMLTENVERFEKAFGFKPTAVCDYVMDACMIRILKELVPELKVVVASCFEEGVKTFHGCNNSWFLFSEGTCWGPWYPSKGHSARPAENEGDWSGVVAVPHLCRDLVLAYENRDDFFASHPANVQRGLANEGMIHDYDFNLIDQYRLLEDYNYGQSYYQINVSPQWFSHNFNIIDPDEITKGVYVETLEYLKQLADEGQVESLTFSDFADKYRREVPIEQQSVALANDILMGSGKQYFWVCDSGYRVLLDLFQGGSIGDLRPFGGKYNANAGPDVRPGRYNYVTYPYLIQSQYRSGNRTHLFTGTRTTLFVTHGGETLDMCDYNTRKESFSRTVTESTLTLQPVEMVFDDGFRVTIQTVYHFCPKGKIEVTRKILSTSDPNETFRMEEHVKGTVGFIEYPEDLKEIDLTIDGGKVGSFNYELDSFTKTGAKAVGVRIPSITTDFSLCTDRKDGQALLATGDLFDYAYTMQLGFEMTEKEKEIKTWLQISTTEA